MAKKKFGQSAPVEPEYIPEAAPVNTTVADKEKRVASLVLARIERPKHLRRMRSHYLYRDFYRVNAWCWRVNASGTDETFIGQSWFVESDGEQIFDARPAFSN